MHIRTLFLLFNILIYICTAQYQNKETRFFAHIEVDVKCYMWEGDIPNNILYSKLVAEPVPEIRQKMGLMQVEQGFFFFIFCQLFSIFDDFSNFCSTFGALPFENHQIWQKIKNNCDDFLNYFYFKNSIINAIL